MFYAAARGGNADLFRMLLDHAMSPRCSTYGRDGDSTGAGAGDRASVFRLEMMSRAVHAAARGGSVRMLKELIDGRSDVSAYLDIRGSTVLHAAAGRGQLEVQRSIYLKIRKYLMQVVTYLMASFDMINSTDNQGNTALHVAAYRGHLPVVNALVAASPSAISAVNNAGDTFLHSAIAGFRTPGFRRLDRQLELTKHLIRERAADIRKIINLRNDTGLTALHMAVIGCVHPDLVELLMTTPSIDLNVEDADGTTPLALLKEQLRSTTSERLIKQIVSAGGVLSSSVLRSRSAVVSQIKMRGGIAISPGTMFKISDAEILLHSGIAATESRRASSCSSDGKCDPVHADANGEGDENHGSSEKRLSSAGRAKDRLKMMLRWPRHREKMSRTPRKSEDGGPLDTIKKLNSHVADTPTPLRQAFTKTTALNNKRTLAVKSSAPSSASKKKLIHGIMEAMPHLAAPSASTQSPPSTLPRSSMSSAPTSTKLKDICFEEEESTTVTPPFGKLKDIILDNDDGADDPSCSNSSFADEGVVGVAARRNHGCGNGRLINICFGAQGLTVEDSASGQPTSKMFKQQCLRVS
ncbi:unnamed protein product [Triticum turgidum subsp. durum]|uniref:Uncharacterized protein n=1 Tax=Triticum turgidum subsp. durum TaxID=4567 RepID=A0A9R0Y0Z2_TRITD|nr:unnamed protein product [Triticum turgidum subsp. durum]